MTTSSLGYAIIEATDIAAWRKFGVDVLGLMATDSPDGGLRFRMDDRPFRIAIVPAKEDRFVASGWELPNVEAYKAVLKSLSDAGVEVSPGTKEDAADRKVRELSRCKDPSGNLLEIYHGRVYDYAPFTSPAGVSGFVTGNMGLGHVVLPAPKVEETRGFYKHHLGFGDTDEMRVPIGVPDHPGLALYFMHCDNPRHHSLALFEAEIPGGLVHLMLEVNKFDDLGRCIDRCKKNGTPISINMGRHSNDLMVSSYIKTPSGFDIEYGWDAWQVDWSTYVPTKSEIFSLWGHPEMSGGSYSRPKQTMRWGTGSMINLEGKTALVTGGGAGMGRAIAEAFGAYGVKVAIAEIDPDRAASVRKTLDEAKVDNLVEVVDVREKAQVAALAGKIDGRFGGLDILVNNVGDFMGIVGPFATSTEDQWDTLYQVNLKQMFTVTHAMLPLLRRSGNGGSIINVSSIEGFRGIPGGVVYGAFKAGITGFTQSLAVELGPEGIRVNTIAPETTDTEQVQVTNWTNPKYMDHTKRWIPLGRFGVPKDAAGCAVFLASELSAWVTGTTIHMDGGALAAAGWYRTPAGQWTNMPVIADKGLIF